MLLPLDELPFGQSAPVQLGELPLAAALPLPAALPDVLPLALLAPLPEAELLEGDVLLELGDDAELPELGVDGEVVAVPDVVPPPAALPLPELLPLDEHAADTNAATTAAAMAFMTMLVLRRLIKGNFTLSPAMEVPVQFDGIATPRWE
jgi:hypothetical protein